MRSSQCPLADVQKFENAELSGRNFGTVRSHRDESVKLSGDVANKTLMDAQKKIACIGWGSLVWNPGMLPHLGGWHQDGPMLPVEFARESADRRITLVICKNVREVQTLWTLLDANDIDSARQQLGLREYDAAKPKWIEANIGFWEKSHGTSHGDGADAIATWAKARDLAGVVWTNLGCGFRASRGIVPSGAEVVAHLRGLDCEERANAEEYVRKTPRQVSTAYRDLIAAELGWI